MIIRLQDLGNSDGRDIRTENFQDADSEYSQGSEIGHRVQKIKVVVLTMTNSDLLSEFKYHAYNSKYLS